MNSDKSFNALIAKARAIYGDRIKAEEYRSLMLKTSVPQVIQALKNTSRYKNDLNSVNETQTHRGQLESLLSKSVFEIYMKLSKFTLSGKNSFNRFYIYKKEMDIILDTIMFINLEQYDSIVTYLPMYLSKYISFDLTEIAKVRNYDTLIKILSDTPYAKILSSALPNAAYRTNEKLDFEELVITMYNQYYKWLFQCIDDEFGGNTKNQLREELFLQANLDNLIMMYRMKSHFNRSPEAIRRLLLPLHKGINEDVFNSILTDSHGGEKILDYAQNKVFKNKVKIDKDFLELSAERFIYQRHRSRLRLTSSGPLTLYSLIKLLEVEQNNITTILEGVRYSLPATEIEKLIVI